MANDLVNPDDLVDLPGAPFTEAEVDAAVTAIRAEAGWHIAPVRTETVARDVNLHESFLPLPTGRLVEVVEVRDLISGTTLSADLWWASRRMGSIRRAGCWPRRYESIEVDMTHGYDGCPPDLLGAIAAVAVQNRSPVTASGDARSMDAGPYRITFAAAGADGQPGPFTLYGIIARYSVSDWWGWA